MPSRHAASRTGFKNSDEELASPRGEFAGSFSSGVVTSTALADNPLGDSATRPLWVYLPPGYDEGSETYPAIYLLHGFLAALDTWEVPIGSVGSQPEIVDRAFAAGTLPPCIVVWVDAGTKLGGSQYIDSLGVGRYQTYLCDDVVAYVDAHFRTRAVAAHRAVLGYSSGGYGAIVAALRRPDVFCGFASHAGDCGFDICLSPCFRVAARALRDRYAGSYDAFLASLGKRSAPSGHEEELLALIRCLSACYCSEQHLDASLPFDIATGALIPEVWREWQRWDPIEIIKREPWRAAALHASYLDAGDGDEWFADLGSEALARALVEGGARDVVFERFAGDHLACLARTPHSLRYLAPRIS